MHQEIPNCFYRIGIKALIINDKKDFLLAKDENGLWDIPGGGLEFNESPHEALKRELFEETGLEVSFIAENPSYF